MPHFREYPISIEGRSKGKLKNRSMLYYETSKFLDEVVHDPTAGTDKQDLWTRIGRYTYIGLLSNRIESIYKFDSIEYSIIRLNIRSIRTPVTKNHVLGYKIRGSYLE
jgi:hypothetical protein